MMGEDDWDPFGRPLFDDPEVRDLRRVGILDVGSNSIRLVVFDGAARSPAYFYNEKVMAGLGTGIAETGHLNPEGKVRAMSALRRFALLAKAMDISPMMAVATAAMREAADGPAFRDQIAAETGIEIRIVDGDEEARLSAQGVLLGWPEAEGLVCDIGGASMELAEIADGAVGRRLTSPLGPQRLGEIGGGTRGLRRHLAAKMDHLAERVAVAPERLFLVGGSWRAIARLDMLRRDYPLTVLHEYRLTAADVARTVRMIGEGDHDALRAAADISESRMALVPLAAEVLGALVRRFEPGEIAVSSYGIREGMLYEAMPPALKARDPLIESCRFNEAKDARMPGFGRELHKFIRPLFDVGPDRYRIHRAACLLHDVAWRAHPDYRHEVCFDAVTRANLGGLTHAERVFMGLALLHRYKNSRAGSRLDALVDLLPEADRREAEILGRAMRFGAMLSIADHSSMGALSWDPETGALALRLAAGTGALYGEVAASRFNALGRALGAERITVDG